MGEGAGGLVAACARVFWLVAVGAGMGEVVARHETKGCRFLNIMFVGGFMMAHAVCGMVPSYSVLLPGHPSPRMFRCLLRGSCSDELSARKETIADKKSIPFWYTKWKSSSLSHTPMRSINGWVQNRGR